MRLPNRTLLIQALAQRNIFPVIQTLIFKDGKTFDNFFEMIKSNVFIKGDDLITEVDLYFPDKKLAVFCDSTQFHRGSKNKSKDELVSAKLLEIGIKTVRISGKEIIENLNKAVDLIVSHL
ncbi:MAG: hypothetical protein IPP31_00030 [Chitinophagaceae bacterium]|nr:hypothetical protein [Chitinophagaceae bacterium]